jgi:hypothetical protein
MEQRVLKGSTTTIVSYPRLRPSDVVVGVPSNAKVRVWGPSVPAPEAFTTALVDTVNTTVTAEAREGDTEVAIVAATLVRGRQYLLTAASGALLVVESRTGGNTTTLALAQPLPVDVDVGASLRGFAVTRALTALETANVGQASALWQATVDGSSVEWSQCFRVVRRIPTALLTPTRLTQAYPILLSMAPPTGLDLEAAIAAAWEHQMVGLLEAKGVFDENVLSDETIVPLHALACCRQLFDFDPRADAAFVARLEKKWDAEVATTFARVGYAEREQTEDPLPRVPAVDEGRGRMRLRP